MDCNHDQMKQDFTEIGWALILSQLTMFFLSLLGSLLASFLLHWFSPLRDTWTQMEGWIISIAATGGAIPMLLLGYGNDRFAHMLDQRERVWPVQVIFYFLMVLGMQMLVSVASAPIVGLLESAGASFEEAAEVATSYAASPSMLFYTIALAPICEEIIYRGALLRSLEPYGKWFAVVISALVFGLMHGNAVQFPVAFAIGVVFAYLALKYSLKLTILLHVMNNLFVELSGRLSAWNESMGVMLNGGLLLAGMLSLILLALSGGKPVLRDLKNNRTPKATYGAFFSRLPVVCVFVFFIVLTLASIFT